MKLITLLLLLPLYICAQNEYPTLPPLHRNYPLAVSISFDFNDINAWEQDKLFALDKIDHAFACMFITTISGGVIYETTHWKCSDALGALVGLGCGIGKEWIDSKKGKPSYNDLIADGIGCIGGFFISKYVNKYFDDKNIPIRIK